VLKFLIEFHIFLLVSVLIFLFVTDEFAVHGIEGPISGIPLSSDSGKKKILLLKGKQREIPSVGFVLPIKVSFLFNNIWYSHFSAFFNHVNVMISLICFKNDVLRNKQD